MEDTATIDPDTDLGTPESAGVDAGEYIVQTGPEQPSEPAGEGRSPSRRRPQAVPLIVHGTNATGIAVGVAYVAAGVPGLIAAGAAGAAVGAAALAGRKRSKVSAARAAANRSSITGGGRRTGAGSRLTGRGSGGSKSGRPRKAPGQTKGSGASGRRSGGGRHVAPGPSAGGRSKRSQGGKNAGGLKGGKAGLKGLLPHLKKGTGGGAAEPGANTPKESGGKNTGDKGSSGAPSRSGKAWQTVKGWAAKARRSKNSGAGGASGGTGAGTGGSGTAGGGAGAAAAGTRRGRLWQKIRRAAGKLRRARNGAGSGGNAGTAQPRRVRDRIYRMRRLVVRKLGHWARCTGAGVLAGLGGLFTLPLGLLWGAVRMVTRHRDPLHAFAFPVRTAGRIWRFFYRRSKARHDNETKADQLNLTVNDPRKDSDPVSGPSLVSGTSVLDGNTSKFALAMRAAHSTYTSYHPRSMMEVAAEYAGLPNAIRATASAAQQMAVNSDQKYPCSKRAVAKLTEAFRVVMVAASRADVMNVLFRSVHQFDIERIVAPRTNEWMWNVTPTGSTAPEGAMFMPGRIETGCVLMAVLYRTFEPVHMMQVGSEFQGISYGLTALADAIDTLRQRTRDLYPVDDRVLDELGTIVRTVRAAADHADMAAKLFVEDHRREISHNTHPRKGPAAEGMWNTPH